jgi:hypothetical protein
LQSPTQPVKPAPLPPGCKPADARVLRGAAVTADRYPVGTAVCVQDPGMKQAWCLAARQQH